MTKKTDLRVLKTQKLIKEALISLIDRKGFESITIQDVADEALINRATFYLHYQDKYDLLEQISNAYLNELMDAADITFHLKKGEVNVNRFKITLRKVIENIEKNKLFYQVMLGPNGIPNFTNKIEKLLSDKFKMTFNSVYGNLNQLEVPVDLILSFISSAYIGVLKWWLSDEGSTYSVDFMVEQLATLITKGPINAIGHKMIFNEEDN
ncbi:TetR/AcrR family transcriptional regulator [Lysinibacillus sp. BW-2-10]|uniref:TetR/AcrR family transcriptional regulator n=1 Tax=Lysinibacillus sp. BW-2-10 TaxID=2590030 RepID=UPI0011815B53|nr:TetR/AcrR family transcriptional regulator C-terminal domain-containing protein [Lysinibacillus sp. BW-2-10]TSI05759.1 TetR/AcrR family transcriptional regulator [Lysinibacillus sp. BW-2-10]